MRKLTFVCALLACGPALGNDRADSEARLAALSDAVTVALGAAMPQVTGMVCTPGKPDESATNRMFVPNWRGECSWAAGQSVQVYLILSRSVADDVRTQLLQAKEKVSSGATPAEHVYFATAPEIRAMRISSEVKAAPSKRVVGLAAGSGNRTWAALDALADAFAAMDTSAVESLPEVAAHEKALAGHRALLEGHVVALAALLPPAADGRDPAARPPKADFPDHMFFGFEPLVQAQVIEAGVAMTVTLTTSSFALENAVTSGQFTGQQKNGDIGPDGVFHDRGRVQVYLAETQMTALIDGRAILMMYVPDVVEGTDPLAAMEAVLTRMAANDFSDY